MLFGPPVAWTCGIAFGLDWSLAFAETESETETPSLVHPPRSHLTRRKRYVLTSLVPRLHLTLSLGHTRATPPSQAHHPSS